MSNYFTSGLAHLRKTRVGLRAVNAAITEVNCEISLEMSAYYID